MWRRKTKPRADYPIMVQARSRHEEPERAQLHAGIYEMCLNVHVNIWFIPQMPPIREWDGYDVPVDSDDIATTHQARLDAALHASYVVLPDEELAGRDEKFPQGGWRFAEVADTGIVFYVKPVEFQRCSQELASMAEQCGEPPLDPSCSLSRLQDRWVVRFVHQRIVTSGLLAPKDAAMLRDR